MSYTNKRLRRININGFKSIKNCCIELNETNVLIGSNGAGKSNFISVFTLLQNIIDKNLQIYSARTGVNSLLFNGRKTTDHIEMEFDFGSNSYGFVLIPTDDGRLVFKDEYFEFNGTKTPIQESRGSPESNWDKGVGNGMDGYVIPAIKERPWKIYHFHDTSRTANVKQEHNIQDNIGLSYDAGNLAAFLYRLKKERTTTYREILNTVQLVAPYIDDFILEPEGTENDKIRLKWKQKGCDDIFTASQFSDGTLRFICLTTLLLQPREFQPTTIIIDEPELGLHPYAIGLFADMVRNVSKDIQTIISTQSVELLNEFDIGDVIVVESDDGVSRFEKLDEDGLRMWLEDDYTLGDLWKKNLLGGRP